MPPKQHKAALIPSPNQPFQIGMVDTPEPAYGQLRIKVTACGICYTDHFVVDGSWPGLTYPHIMVITGHEAIGRVDAIGEGVPEAYKIGQKVGVGWPAGYCNKCEPCVTGDKEMCQNLLINGFSTIGGGFQEYLIAYADATVRFPETDAQTDAELAPLLCAGCTVYGALRESDYKPGDLCLIQGMGGLGHLAVQYAQKLGLRSIGISNTPEKGDLIKSLGADDVWHGDEAVEKAKALGGAKILLATSTNTASINALLPTLGPRGEAIIVGSGTDEDVKINVFSLILGRLKIRGSLTANAAINEENVRFALLRNVKAVVNTFPLEKIQEAYDEVHKGRPKFRNVILFE